MKSYSRSAWRRLLLHTMINYRTVNKSLQYLWKALNDLTGNSSSMGPLFEHIFEVLVVFFFLSEISVFSLSKME